MDHIPERWPATDPHKATAYVVDLSYIVEELDSEGGEKVKALDAYLKAEDQDSWGKGTNGSTKESVSLLCLDGLAARRSVHECNGAYQCEHFDPAILEGYSRSDGADMSKMKEIFALEMKKNEADGGSILGITSSFYHMIKTLKCKKKDCVGVPVLKPLSNAPSSDGKNNFVGCSLWKKSEKFDHIYVPLPSQIDEAILFQLMNGREVTSMEVEVFEAGCSTLIHPRHGKQTMCRKLRKLYCPVRKIVYTSKNPAIPKVVVIFEGQHSHPPWPQEKVTLNGRKDLKKCMDMLGRLGVTGMTVDNAPSTLALLGMSLSEKHPAFRSRKVLSETVQQNKLQTAPAGADWQGIVDQWEKDQWLPKEDRYLWHVRMDGSIKLAVTMHPTLARLIHTALSLECDYTFKRVHGDLNECEFVIWHRATNERITVARLYCNSATREAFGLLFEGFFKAVEQATGQAIRFKVFHPAGNLLTVIFDMEAAQVQGFADAIVRLRLNDPNISKIDESNPDILIQYILKLCYFRGTDKLVQAVGKDVVDYLNKFPALSTQNDIDEFHKFCETYSESHPVFRNWYAHKTNYSWLLPGFNRFLSRVPENNWDVSRNNTNLVETAHAHTNRNTRTNLKPLEAIETARIADGRLARSIASVEEDCILHNRNNSEADRYRRVVSRRVYAAQRRSTHQDLDDQLYEIRADIASTAALRKDLQVALKNLEEKKKGAGRTPRHNRAAKTRFNVTVPQIHSQMEALALETS
ncbi:hypothetical protein H0H92_007610, partial [Tricholoma furcatifolium]